MAHDVEWWPFQPYKDKSECIYWRIAMFNLLEETDHIMTNPLPQVSRSVVFALSYLSFEPAQTCFHHQQVAKESKSKTQVCSFVNAIKSEHITE